MHTYIIKSWDALAKLIMDAATAEVILWRLSISEIWDHDYFVFQRALAKVIWSWLGTPPEDHIPYVALIRIRYPL